MRLLHHQNQWKYNEKVINWATDNEFSFNDWIITIAFYAALHKIDYCLHIKANINDYEITHFIDRLGNKIRGHGARNKLVRRHLTEISQDYIILYSECRRVRYDQTTLNQIGDKEVETYLKIWFEVINKYNPKKK